MYVLEIYEPGSLTQVWVSVEAESPFMALNEGDVISPFAGQESGEGTRARPNFRDADSELVVGRLEHIIEAAGGRARHKIMVFTEEAKTRRGQVRRRIYSSS